MKVNTKLHSLYLFLAACIWGMAFVAQSKGMEYMDPFTFNGARALIGAFSLLIFVLIRDRFAQRKLKDLDWKLTITAGTGPKSVEGFQIILAIKISKI